MRKLGKNFGLLLVEGERVKRRQLVLLKSDNGVSVTSTKGKLPKTLYKSIIRIWVG